MKLIYKFFLLLSSVAFFSCTDEAFIEGTSAKGLTAEIPFYEFEGKSTRVNISENLNTYTWSNGDVIGLYYKSYVSNANAVFRIDQGGSNSGNFSNDAFRLKPNSTYYACYPYNSEATIDNYPVDFTGQVQTVNGSTSHIGARNYMSAEAKTDENGDALIAFQNQAAVIQLLLPIEEDGTYTSVGLSTSDADFIAKGTLNMKSGKITSTQMAKQINVTFDKGLSLKEGETLTVNVLVAPVDLSERRMSAVLIKGDNYYRFDNLEGLNIQKGKAYKVDCVTGVIGEIPYITFIAEAEQTLRMTQAVETLEYSVNGGDWQKMGTNTVDFGGTKGKLQLRGKSSIGTAKSATNYSKFIFGNDELVACSGDIRTLVDYENFETVDTKNAAFTHLFSNRTNLTTAPDLPATDLAPNCYDHMFKGCTSLTAAPMLPATNLAPYCYYYMFRDCTSLTTAPELPATKLESYCYDHMFEGCTSLSAAPVLPATNLASSCYAAMFSGCTSLSTAPVLPATNLASSCYTGMFSGCTSLTAAPVLNASKLTSNCYAYMFSGCTGLSTAPVLNATDLESNCYDHMFYGCTSLIAAPVLNASKIEPSSYAYMFNGCTSLATAPKLPATNLASNCYEHMFDGCISLATAPELPASNIEPSSYAYMFSGCTTLITAPKLPATNLASNCYEHMFDGCIRLTTAPVINASKIEPSSYAYMFSGCISLITVQNLPATNLASNCYDHMFSGCTSLTAAPMLPATNLAPYCYYYMFSGCTSLTTAPELPATKLESYCYQDMFNKCSNLNYIKMMATDISAKDCLSYWTSGVSYHGTFIKSKDATWDVRGISGIPTGWTVESADYNYQNGREHVDLGLPSGTLWATHNIGANGIYDAGTEFTAWSSTDKASAAWGTAWTTPTRTQLEELNENVTWEQHYKYPSSWSEYMATRSPAINDNFYDGCYFTATSKINGNVLILPAKLFYSEDMMSEFLMTNLMGIDTQMLLGVHYLNGSSSVGPGFFTHEMENYDPSSEKEWYYDSYYFNHIRPVTKR